MSSFGDIVQCLGVAQALKNKFPGCLLHWVVRSDYYDLVSSCKWIDHIHKIDRQDGIQGLIKLIGELRQQNFTHIYDAHNNLRSLLICWFVKTANLIRRPKQRIYRWLLFCWRINLFDKPFKAQISYLKPLQKWQINQFGTSDYLVFTGFPETPLKKNSYVTLVPSAAWPVKRWPLKYWQQLINLCPQTDFAILGGPDDAFCSELRAVNQKQMVVNFAGKLSLIQSCQILSQSQLVISNETGFSHVADVLKKPLVVLIGPTAFGYPIEDTSKVLEVDLYCKPCSKDGHNRCRNKVYQKCLLDLSPEMVALKVKGMLK